MATDDVPMAREPEARRLVSPIHRKVKKSRLETSRVL